MFYMQQLYCTQYEQNRPIPLPNTYNTTNIHNVWNNGHNFNIFGQGQCMFYMHHKIYKNIAIITDVWHGAKWYSTCIRNSWYLVTVSNLNKISPFFSDILAQIHKMYEKVTIITQMWYRGKCYFTSMSNMWYLIIVPNMSKITPIVLDCCTKYEQNQSLFLISQQNIKFLTIIAIFTQICMASNVILHASAIHGTWLLYQIWKNI